YIDEKLDDLELLAGDPATAAAFDRLARAYADGGADSPPYREAYETFAPHFGRVAEIGGYYDLFLITVAGDVVFAVKRESDFGTNLVAGPDADTPLATVFRSSQSLLEPDLSPLRPYAPSGGALAAFVAAPLVIGDRLVGGVATQVDNRRFEQVLTDDTGLGETGETVVVERTDTGSMVVTPLKHVPDAPYHLTFTRGAKTPETIRRALAGERGAGRAIDYRGTPVIAAWRYIPSARVGMVVKIDESEALAVAARLERVKGAVAVGVVVCLLLIFGYLSRQILRPLALLESTTAALAGGDLASRVPVEREDEFGRVATGFNRMADALLAARDTLEETVARRTAALREESDRRQKLATELAEAGALRQAILQNAAVAIIATDTQGIIRSFNPGAERMLGYAADEVVGRTTPAILHDPAEVAARAAALTRELGRPVAASFEAFVAKASLGLADESEWTYRQKGGGRLTVRLSVTPLRDERGDIVGYMGVAFDITGQKEDERALRRSEEALALAQRIVSMGSWDWNILTGELSWSDEIYRIFGFTPQQFGATYEAFLATIHPDDRQRVTEAVDRAVSGTHPYDVEHRVVRPDGEIRFVREQGEVTRDVGGAPVRMLGTVHDITPRKRAEERIRLAAKVFESAGEAIVITDHTTRIVEVNPAYLAITGYAREEVVGRRPSLGASGRHDEAFYREMWRQVNETGGWSGEIWDRRKEGDVYPTLLTISAITDDYGQVTHYVGVFVDISHQKRTEESLQRLAYYDPLTALPNRALFRDRLAQALEQARRHTSKVALFFLDLDRFKNVNDTLGHDAGDDLLVEASRRIGAAIRATDTLARLGGDEFTVILGELDHVDDAGRIARTIIDALTLPFSLKGHDVFIGASVGIGIFPDDGATDEELIKNADMAMYQAKGAGRGTYAFFEEEMNRANLLRRELEQGMRRGIGAGEFVLYYQPKIDLATGGLAGAEALIRWRHPQKGLLFPDTFIPMAEETGLILPLGAWTLTEACRQLAAWDRAGLVLPSLSVNLSARQFAQADLAETVRGALTLHGVPPERLELEITESAVMADPARAIETVKSIRAMGVRFSMDDFGTGYSSLSQLKKFPLDALKIDKAFVLDLINDPDDRAIVASIVSLGGALGLKVVAEGVESPLHVTALQELGAGFGQGYHWAKPLPPDDFARFMDRPKGP
ncbi:MAG: EAL domain-containing protein, partial [Nitrospinae bacterium]|nr:EAL domain-containing protein [Nitrospinota bacterium]